MDGYPVRKDGTRSTLRLTESWYLQDNEPLPWDLAIIDNFNEMLITQDIEHLRSIVRYFLRELPLQTEDADKIWGIYLRKRQEKLDQLVLGRKAVFGASGVIKFYLRDKVSRHPRCNQLMPKLANAFHELMDHMFGHQRNRVLVWT